MQKLVTKRTSSFVKSKSNIVDGKFMLMIFDRVDNYRLMGNNKEMYVLGTDFNSLITKFLIYNSRQKGFIYEVNIKSFYTKTYKGEVVLVVLTNIYKKN
ncbi:hypothetical protein K2F43_19735 [Clostridium estertheticum]|uniref:hypothetical protein n=1 Tax=Clostridium estertheticum TaxID=238834 RepID=UPI001C6F0D04|nr:hypothetical protein [Clostridium estertheticum]MBW9173423.1 hypothetical protein [Clostridium estertheticum]WLC76574.1 hypothetical protein KTC99_07190 [Clostridium estertheticum]